MGDTMSAPMESGKRRPPRLFTEEFRASAVRLGLDDGKAVGAAARSLELTETALLEWVLRTRAARPRGRTGLMAAEGEESDRLRKANCELRSERVVLETAAAFFAKHQA